MRKLGLLLLLALGAATFGLWKQYSGWPIYEFHDVTIVKVYDPYHFLLSKSDGPFNAYFCHDYRPDLRAGLVLDRIRFEDRGACWSVERMEQGFGYWYKHDAAGNDIDYMGRSVHID